MRNKDRELLASYVDALYPIIYINHFDFKVVDEMIMDIAGDRKVVEFNNGIGIVDFKNKSVMREYNLMDFLKAVKDDGYDNANFLVLKDVHNQLEEPEIISLLKYIASRNLYNEYYNTTVFVVSNKLKIPVELEDFITVFDIKLPGTKEITNIINEFVKDLKIEVKEDVAGELALSFKGLNEFQIKQILNLAYQDGGCIDADDKQLILKQKEQLIKKAGLLEMIQLKESVSDIGGLENLKDWLYRKGCIFEQLDKAIKYGVDIPKGIMIVGMPGCGKSLAAKATAKLFGIPLVRLDVGRLLGKYVGESEENMRKALQLSEAISPCVLWVDEIEKAFAGVGSNGGSDVTTRLFGQFLTWMQEKENTVFIVATANDISNIPPEFLRKGRFDELFFVDFPNKYERKKIIELHLKKRDKWNRELDVTSLVKVTDGYNGADLEAIVKDAIENSFIAGFEQLVTKDLLNAQKNIKSISKTLESRIKEIRTTIEKMDLKMASRDDDAVAVPYYRKVVEKQYNPLDEDVVEFNSDNVRSALKAQESLSEEVSISNSKSNIMVKFEKILSSKNVMTGSFFGLLKTVSYSSSFELGNYFLANGNFISALKVFESEYKKGDKMLRAAYYFWRDILEKREYFVHRENAYDSTRYFEQARSLESEFLIEEAAQSYLRAFTAGRPDAYDDYLRIGGAVLDVIKKDTTILKKFDYSRVLENLVWGSTDEICNLASNANMYKFNELAFELYVVAAKRGNVNAAEKTVRYKSQSHKKNRLFIVTKYDKAAFESFKLGVAELQAKRFISAKSCFDDAYRNGSKEAKNFSLYCQAMLECVY